jgi:hypothetical protein
LYDPNRFLIVVIDALHNRQLQPSALSTICSQELIFGVGGFASKVVLGDQNFVWAAVSTERVSDRVCTLQLRRVVNREFFEFEEKTRSLPPVLTDARTPLNPSLTLLRQSGVTRRGAKSFSAHAY